MFRDLLMEDLNNNVNAIIKLANSNPDAQLMVKLALTEEGVNDIPPDLIAKIVNMIRDAIGKK